MFILTRFKDVVKLSPRDFKGNFNDAIAKTLNKKLANKIFHNIGLCITLFDIEKIEEPFIFPGDGSSHTKVVFRYVVFKPFKEELLIGRITRCSEEEGLTVSLGFFDDIIIPPSKLPDPSKFNTEEQVWVWDYLGPDGQRHDLYMDVDCLVKFRVRELEFNDLCPTGSSRDSGSQPETKVPPFILKGSIDESGLGLLQWWESPDSE